ELEVEKKESSVFSDCTDPYAWDSPDRCVVFIRDTDGAGVTVMNFSFSQKTKGAFRLMEEWLKDGYKGGPIIKDVDYYFTPVSKMPTSPEPTRFPDEYLRDMGM
ncbi:hypothetical protein OAJ43_00490, partial [Nitrosomonadales bacterium]|nr:hypothetical protein [Nitrosomonadales bacterium]